MVKYHLLKEFICADNSYEKLREAQNKMKQVFDYLNDAKSKIQTDFEGQEFEIAASHIAEILKKNEDLSTEITQLMQKLKNEVREYNLDIIDADGNPDN